MTLSPGPTTSGVKHISAVTRYSGVPSWGQPPDPSTFDRIILNTTVIGVTIDTTPLLAPCVHVYTWSPNVSNFSNTNSIFPQLESTHYLRISALLCEDLLQRDFDWSFSVPEILGLLSSVAVLRCGFNPQVCPLQKDLTGMAKTKQTARRSTGSNVPQKHTATRHSFYTSSAWRRIKPSYFGSV